MTQFWAKLSHLDDPAGSEVRTQRRRGTERSSINKKNGKCKEGRLNSDKKAPILIHQGPGGSSWNRSPQEPEQLLLPSTGCYFGPGARRMGAGSSALVREQEGEQRPLVSEPAAAARTEQRPRSSTVPTLTASTHEPARPSSTPSTFHQL